MEEKNSYSRFFALIFFVIIGGLVWWGISYFNEQQRLKEQKPFWKGTEYLQVCKQPYDSSGECYKANVTLVNSKTAIIELAKGSRKRVSNIRCYYSARTIESQPDYIFCRTWDSNNEQFDILPLHAYWPSAEDLDKIIENQLK